MNLERMSIGYKPLGFPLERKNRMYWNNLELSVSGSETTARIKHWTGRVVCSASTKEVAISKFLYNHTDAAAVEAVGKILSQRALETGITEVRLDFRPDDLKKERMKMFIDTIKEAGLILSERKQYHQNDPHRGLSNWSQSMKPWNVVDE